MGNFLQSASQFLGGVSQGTPQGLDLYQKYQTVQDENQKRQKKQQFETKVSELAQNGGFDDPVKGVRMAADYARELGDIDTYLTYNDHANQLQKTAADRTGLQVYQAAMGGDFGAAMQGLNEFATTLNTGSQYDLQQRPDGWSAIINTNGKKSEVPLKTKEDVQEWFMTQTEPYLFKDVGEYLKSEREGQKTEAEVARAKSATELAQEQTVTERDTREAQIALLGQQAEAQGASAMANRAQAGYYSAQAAAEPGKAAAEAEERQARIGLLKVQTENFGQGVDPDISLVVQRTAPPEPLPGDPVDPAQSQQARLTIGTAISTMGVDPETSVGMADALMNSGGQYTIDPANNTVYMADGTPVKMGAQGWQELLRLESIRKAQGAVEP